MIDPLTEELINLNVAASLYPRGPGGRKVHVAKVRRHITTGIRGIQLEGINTPALVTSRQAVARFFRRLSEVQRPKASPTRDAPTQRINEKVECELDRLGF